ncbi:unnamed protein product [Cunninghamella echinulata]
MSNNTFEVLGEGPDEGEIIHVEFFKFSGLVADAKVSIQDTTFNKADYPSYVSLLACSKIYGYFVAGHTEGFVFGQTKQLRQTFYNTDKGSITALEDKIIIPVTEALVHHYNYLSMKKQLSLKEAALPTNKFEVESAITDLRPNPEAIPEAVCLLLEGNKCCIKNWKTGDVIADIPGTDFSSICWSPKGKQVACGRLQGSLEFYDIKGDKKDTITSPESMQAGYGDEKVDRNVQAVLWIENHQFLVVYARPVEPENDEYINDGFIIDRKPKLGNGPIFIRVPDITPIFSPEGRSNHFYMELLRHFGKNIPHLVILANGATNEISVVGEDSDGKWTTWYLPENGMASLPLSEETNFDTFPLGLALDFTATEKLPPYDASEDETGVEPFPVLLYINDEGHICSHHCYSEELAKEGKKYEGMKTPIDIHNEAMTSSIDDKTTTTVEKENKVEKEEESSTATFSFGSTTTATTTTTSTNEISKSAFATSPFGAALQSNTSGTSFASLAKVQGATNPTSNFGLLAKQTVPNTVTPTFGSATSFGSMKSSSSFGAASSAPSASLASFGKAATVSAPITTSAFTSITPNNDSNSSFEIIKDANDSPNKDSDDSNKENISFGSLTINNKSQSEKKDSLATTPTPPPALAFGSLSSPAKKEVPSLFGTSPTKKDDASAPTNTTTTGFGTLAKKDNTHAFGSTTGFGAFSGFGATSKKDDSNTPAFGSTTGFGALAKKDNVPAFGSTTGFGAMAKKDDATPAFGSTTGFGALAKKDNVPAFGTTTGFDSMANKESVPAFGTTTTSTTTTAGFGSFGALAKNKVPGAVNPQAGPISPFQDKTIKSTAETKEVKEVKEIKEVKDTKEAIKTEPVKSDSKEGMAKEFESLYFKITEELKKLSVLHTEFAEQLKNQDKQLSSMSKSVKDLNSNLEQWRLGDCKDLGIITHTVATQLEGCDTKSQIETLKTMELKTAELMDKQVILKECLDNKEADKLKITLKNVKLDESVRKDVETIQKRSSSQAETLKELESRVHDKIKLQQRPVGRELKNYNNLSFYSLNCAIRNVEKDLKVKDNEIKILEQKLALLRFEENQQKAKASPSRIVFEGLSDDESDEDSEENKDVAALIGHGQFQNDHIDYTVKHLQQENFLETLCDFSNNQSPLSVNIEVTVKTNSDHLQ